MSSRGSTGGGSHGPEKIRSLHELSGGIVLPHPDNARGEQLGLHISEGAQELFTGCGFFAGIAAQRGHCPAAVGSHPSKLTAPAAVKLGPNHSAGVLAVDEQGNVASILHSLNGVLWGSTGSLSTASPTPPAISSNRSPAPGLVFACRR